MKVLNTFMICSCDCKCGAKTHNHKVNEDQKLIRFLLGLNEAYNGVRGNILMMKPLPFTAQAYSIVLHDESQREIQSDTSFSVESSAFMVSGKKWAPQKHHEGAKVGIPNSGADGKRSDLFCNYCKKSGHVKEGCYKLIEYPPHFKFNRQK